MTTEEIIEQLKSIIGAYEILMGHGVNSDILGAVDIEAIREAIKVLKAKQSEWEHDHDVLDKIRAEIDQKQYDFMSDGDYSDGIRFGLMLAYQIIDKYKAESEKMNEEDDRK